MASFISYPFAFYTWAIIKLLTSHLPSPHPLYTQLMCCFISWKSFPVHHTLVSYACWTPYCHKPGGLKQQKLIFSQLWRSGSKSRCPWGCVTFGGYGRIPSLTFPSFWWLLAFFGLWLHHCRLCLCLHRTFPSVCVCVTSLSFSYEEACDQIVQAHQGTAGQFLHVKILIMSARILVHYRITDTRD